MITIAPRNGRFRLPLKWRIGNVIGNCISGDQTPLLGNHNHKHDHHHLAAKMFQSISAVLIDVRLEAGICHRCATALPASVTNMSSCVRK